MTNLVMVRLFFSLLFLFFAPMYHMTRHTLAYHTLLMHLGRITKHYYDTLSNNLTYNTCPQYLTKRLAEPVRFPWKDGCERCVVLHEDITCTRTWHWPTGLGWTPVRVRLEFRSQAGVRSESAQTQVRVNMFCRPKPTGVRWTLSRLYLEFQSWVRLRLHSSWTPSKSRFTPIVLGYWSYSEWSWSLHGV